MVDILMIAFCLSYSIIVVQSAIHAAIKGDESQDHAVLEARSINLLPAAVPMTSESRHRQSAERILSYGRLHGVRIMDITSIKRREI
jgi:hypothetical protein